jgi:hypothetical protein
MNQNIYQVLIRFGYSWIFLARVTKRREQEMQILIRERHAHL